MKKSIATALFFSFLAAACSKDAPPPETPEAHANTAPAPAATAPRPDPIGTDSTGLQDLSQMPMQVQVWTEDGLKLLEPGTQLVVNKGDHVVLHLYPQPADAGALTFNGPLTTARQGGYTVLVLNSDVQRGVYDIHLRTANLPEFPMSIEVR